MTDYSKLQPYDVYSHLTEISKFENTDDLTKEENEKLSKICICIINVEKSIERKEKIIPWINTLGLDTYIFKAVDGTKMNIHDTFHPEIKIIEYNKHYFMLDYTRKFDHELRGPLGTGMIGDALSHQFLYNMIQFQTNYDSILIMEDDASLIKEPHIIRKYLANLPTTFDMAFLNSESKWYPISPTTPINDYYSNIERHYFNAPVSYVISKEGAAKLLVYTRHDVTRPPDDLVSNPHVLGLYTVIVSNEFLFGCDYSFESDTARFSTNL
jgi:GR25 family glycosyltransferase involved in LPS biosynthesis